jgi:hypothetical protein
MFEEWITHSFRQKGHGWLGGALKNEKEEEVNCGSENYRKLKKEQETVNMINPQNKKSKG